MGYVKASEPTSVGRRCPELRNTWQRWSSTQQGGEARGHVTRGSTGAHLSKEVRSEVAGHVVAPEPTSTGRCGPKLQLAWQRVDARSTPCLDLELVCGGTRSSRCRQRPPSPPREMLRTRRWANFSAPCSVILMFLLSSRQRAYHQRENIDVGPPGGAVVEGPGVPTINIKTSTAGPREVPELKVRTCPSST
jgi:hypothetical protein